MSFSKNDSLIFDASQYRIERTNAILGNIFWTINFPDNLQLKLYYEEEQSEQKIRQLADWLFGTKSVSNNAPAKTGSYTISLEKMQEIFPVKGQQLEHLRAVLPYLNAYMADWGITDNNRLAYLLSQLGPETGNFRNFDEKDDGKYSEAGIKGAFTEYQLRRCDDFKTYVKDPNNPEKLFNCMYCCGDENGNEASGDGFRYRGRGLIQLTHKESYRKFTLWYNKNYADDPQNFVENPDLLNQPKYATLSALWEFCVDKNTNNKIFKLIEARDINNITRAINGNSSKDVLNSRESTLEKIKLNF